MSVVQGVTVRQARRSDLKVIEYLFERGAAVYTRVPLKDMEQIVNGRLVLLALQGGEAVGVLVSIWFDQPFAWLDGFAVGRADCITSVVEACWGQLVRHLRGRRAEKVLFSTEVGQDQRLVEALLKVGFTLQGVFRLLVKDDLTIPASGNPAAVIRPAEATDLPALLRIDQSCFEPVWRVEERDLRKTLKLHWYFSVAVDSSRVLGFQYSHIDDEGIGYLVRIGVDSTQQRRGVGTLLLADLMGFFRSQGCSRVEVRTEQQSAAAIRLFTSFGFRPLGAERLVFGVAIPGATRGLAQGRASANS